MRTKIVQEGSDVTISCSATGSPIPHVIWVKVEQEKHFTSRAIERSLLEIKNINKNQGGTYECQATNNPNEFPVTTRVEIVVMCKYNTYVLISLALAHTDAFTLSVYAFRIIIIP